jgi:hypothetical protein
MYRHKQFNQTKPYLQTWTKVIITNHTALQKNLTQERLYKAERQRNLRFYEIIFAYLEDKTVHTINRSATAKTL